MQTLPVLLLNGVLKATTLLFALFPSRLRPGWAPPRKTFCRSRSHSSSAVRQKIGHYTANLRLIAAELPAGLLLACLSAVTGRCEACCSLTHGKQVAATTLATAAGWSLSHFTMQNSMTTNRCPNYLIRAAHRVLVAGCCAAFALLANAQIPMTEIVKTNWTLQSFTNVVDINMPRVVVVNEYRTNTTTRYATNVVEFQRTQWLAQYVTNNLLSYRTNVVTKTQTNVVPVANYTTNVVTAYVTNWTTRSLTNNATAELFRTNLVQTSVTNWSTRIQTNFIVVNLTKTNVFDAFRTNVTALYLTNWQNVLVMKTNLVNTLVTNVATIDLPAEQTTVATPAAARAPEPQRAAVATVAETFDFVIEWARTGVEKPEIVLKLKSPAKPDALLQAQEWRVERSDSAVLVMGNQPEFHGDLPAGDYNVTIKFRPDKTGAVLKLRGTIQVTATDAPQQTPAKVVGQIK
jgi:hypothetical protein